MCDCSLLGTSPPYLGCAQTNLENRWFFYPVLLPGLLWCCILCCGGGKQDQYIRSPQQSHYSLCGLWHKQSDRKLSTHKVSWKLSCGRECFYGMFLWNVSFFFFFLIPPWLRNHSNHPWHLVIPLQRKCEVILIYIYINTYIQLLN